MNGSVERERKMTGYVACEQSQPAEALAASSQLHKQLLAQEVVKLRREVATLRASASFPTVEDDDEIRSRGGHRACTPAGARSVQLALTAVRTEADA